MHVVEKQYGNPIRYLRSVKNNPPIRRRIIRNKYNYQCDAYELKSWSLISQCQWFLISWFANVLYIQLNIDVLMQYCAYIMYSILHSIISYTAFPVILIILLPRVRVISSHSCFVARLCLILSHSFHAGWDNGTIAKNTSSKYFSASKMCPICEITITSKNMDIEGTTLHALMMSRQIDVNICK